MSHAQDVDDLWGDAVIAKIEICVRRNGSMSTAGTIENEAYALAILDHAKDAIRSHHKRKMKLVIKPEDTALPTLEEVFKAQFGLKEIF